MLTEINDSNFEDLVLKSGKPVLVDFWAEWCGPCKMMHPVLEDIAKENAERILVGAVDVDQNQSTTAKFSVRNIPTILFFKEGKIVDKQVGAISKNSLLEKINKLF